MSELQQQGLARLCTMDEPERLDGLTTRLLKDNGNISIWKGESYLGLFLLYAGSYGRDISKILRSLQILKSKGCDFNMPNKDGFSPLDYISQHLYSSPDEPKHLFATVRFVLENGGRCLRRRESVIRYMSYYAGMSREQFEAFEQIGEGKTPVAVIDEKPNMKQSATLRKDMQDRRNMRYKIHEEDQKIAQLESELAWRKGDRQELLNKLKQGTADRNLEAWKKRTMRFDAIGRKHEYVRE